MSKFLLFAILSLASLLCNCNADLIDTICPKSTNPSLCNKSLRSDPRARGADLSGLGQIAVEKARSATLVIQRIAKSLRQGATKAKADACIENCADAINELSQCSALLKQSGRGSIGDLQTKGSAALTDINTCDDEFGSTEPPKLKTASRTAQDFIDVLLVIASRL